MAVVTFYEKPGCKGNLRQKMLLAAAGHTVQAKSLKAEAWTADRLLAFLGKLPVSTWFNPAAPAIKSGNIVPENIGFEHALQLLLENPLLIRRPLMEVGDERLVGFDIAAGERLDRPEKRRSAGRQHRGLRAWPGRAWQLRQPRPRSRGRGKQPWSLRPSLTMP